MDKRPNSELTGPGKFAVGVIALALALAGFLAMRATVRSTAERMMAEKIDQRVDARVEQKVDELRREIAAQQTAQARAAREDVTAQPKSSFTVPSSGRVRRDEEVDKEEPDRGEESYSEGEGVKPALRSDDHEAGGPAVPEWEYVTRLLDHDGDFLERTVDFQGRKCPNSLLSSSTRTGSRTFFWKLADLPSGHKPARFTATAGTDDRSESGSAFRFEFRVNNGEPVSFTAKPGDPAEVSLRIDGVWRIDVSAFGVGDGTGWPVLIEPKFWFH